jgi:hypothetical protein
MFWIFWIVLKYLIYSFVALVIYLVYAIVVNPYYLRWKYSKYPNVFILKPYTLPFGEIHTFIENVKEGKVFDNHNRQLAKEKHDYDLDFTGYGMATMFRIISVKAKKEFNDLVPGKIDREQQLIGVGHMLGSSFASQKSTKDMMRERKIFNEVLSLNSASKYIPTMVEVIQNHLSNWKVNDVLTFPFEINQITFKLFTTIMFCKDIKNLLSQTLSYVSPENEVLDLKFSEYFVRMASDFFGEYSNPLAAFESILAKYHL